MDKQIQSVLLKRDYFTLEQAKKWILDHGHKLLKVDITPEYYRFRQIDPEVLNTLGYKAKSVKLGEVGYMIIFYKE